MNGPNPPRGHVFHPFTLTQHILIRVTVSLKIHLMQRIVFLFGPAALEQVMQSPNPVILPLLFYEHGFDVDVFVLF